VIFNNKLIAAYNVTYPVLIYPTAIASDIVFYYDFSTSVWDSVPAFCFGIIMFHDMYVYNNSLYLSDLFNVVIIDANLNQLAGIIMLMASIILMHKSLCGRFGCVGGRR